MKSRRSKSELFFLLLTTTNLHHSPYQITFHCNLNCTTGKQYLDFLTSKGYLTCISTQPKTSPTRRTSAYTRVNYFLTDEGWLLIKFAKPFFTLSSNYEQISPSTLQVTSCP